MNNEPSTQVSAPDNVDAVCLICTTRTYTMQPFCSICYDQRVNTAFTPCGHTLCRQCAQNNALFMLCFEVPLQSNSLPIPAATCVRRQSTNCSICTCRLSDTRADSPFCVAAAKKDGIVSTRLCVERMCSNATTKREQILRYIERIRQRLLRGFYSRM